MPFDELQKAVLKTLLALRSPDSVFAGGPVLHHHGFRLSDDQDVFHPSNADVVTIAKADIEVLAFAGFSVEVVKEFEGFVEAVVGRPEQGFTKLQWLVAGSWTFFKPVPDPEYGWRLHMADLAVNKVLAAGGRREARDYVDLMMIHENIMPLWHAIWAAPGKDPSWSPGSLAEKIAKTNGFRQEEIDAEIISTIPVSASHVGAVVRQAVEEARLIFDRLPSGSAGSLFVGPDGSLVNDVDTILSGGVSPVSAEKGGNWPSGPDIDHLLIQKVLNRFGLEGSLANDGESGPSSVKP
jgi:hypothetical protein